MKDCSQTLMNVHLILFSLVFQCKTSNFKENFHDQEIQVFERSISFLKRSIERPIGAKQVDWRH